MACASESLRRQVLSIFKKLHRTRAVVFENDLKTLEAARQKINNEFKKNCQVTNTESIQELVKLAQDVEKELFTSVVQAEEKEPGKYRLKMRPEVRKLDNVPYKDCPKG